MFGNYCSILNNTSDNILNKNVMNNYSNCNSYSNHHPPHNSYIVNSPSAVLCNVPFNNPTFIPIGPLIPRNFNFSNSVKPVPGNDSVVPASLQHMPLSAGSIYPSSEQQKSFSSMCG